MTLNSQPPDQRLLKITLFSCYDYYDMVVAPLDLPILPTHLGFPGDYRILSEIDKDHRGNMTYEQIMKDE